MICSAQIALRHLSRGKASGSVSQSGDVETAEPDLRRAVGTPHWAEALETGSRSQITRVLLIIEITLTPLLIFVAAVAQKCHIQIGWNYLRVNALAAQIMGNQLDIKRASKPPSL
jgi:hypothetical protein